MASHVLGMILMLTLLSSISHLIPVHAATVHNVSNEVQQQHDVISKRAIEDPSLLLCQTKTKLILPEMAKNTQGKMKYIIYGKQSENASKIQIETCVNESGQCKLRTGLAPSQTAECRQKYIVKKLVALQDNGQAELDNFSFPFGCQCQIAPHQ